MVYVVNRIYPLLLQSYRLWLNVGMLVLSGSLGSVENSFEAHGASLGHNIHLYLLAMIQQNYLGEYKNTGPKLKTKISF
jgi:hypothetical protein